MEAEMMPNHFVPSTGLWIEWTPNVLLLSASGLGPRKTQPWMEMRMKYDAEGEEDDLIQVWRRTGMWGGGGGGKRG